MEGGKGGCGCRFVNASRICWGLGGGGEGMRGRVRGCERRFVNG